MISDRYSFPVAILIALTLIPTIIHTYTGATHDDQLTTRAIKSHFGSYNSTSTTRKPAYIKNTFDSDDWIERKYTGPGNSKVQLFVARSLDLKRLYHHPEIGILYGVDLVNKGIISMGDTEEIPVRLLNRRTRPGTAGYAMLYDGKFVRNPVKLQVISSIKLLFSPRKPMTLFFVYDSELPADAEFKTSTAAIILEQAIKHFQSQEP